MEKKPLKELERLAHAIRRDVLDMTYGAGVNGGHLGGALSSADILAALYGSVLNLSPEKATNPNRDRFLLSKGHIALAHYAALAECGYISREELQSFEKRESRFQTHPDMCPQKGIEISSGSLGYGLSIGVGIALAGKREGKTYNTYVLMGDGECNEGTVWEAALAAVQFKLDNLVAVIDVNKQQLDGYTEDIMPVKGLAAVFSDLGFHVVEVDGHSMEQLLRALTDRVPDCPTAVIAQTVKGKGISTIEGKAGWHHARITQEQYDLFLNELEAHA